MKLTIFSLFCLTLTSCVNTEYTDAKGGVTKTRKFDNELISLFAPLVIPQPITPVEYYK